MITRVTINNFKKLENISFELSESVVIIGPNNSGKSTIFHALCLWEIGVRHYVAAYQKKELDVNGCVTINRKDLVNSPISDASFLWSNKQVTNSNESDAKQVKLSITLEGNTNGKSWLCDTAFTCANAESIACSVIKGYNDVEELYNNDTGIHFGFLQPMSGLATVEDKLTTGSVDRKLGEGRTAEVLRNICYDILYPETKKPNDTEGEKNWQKLTTSVKKMFGISMHKPEYIKSTGLIELEYTENDVKYDISSGGRGFLQTLLLLAYMYAHPQSVLLLDEPDAHLEVVRQREIFRILTEISSELGTQIIVASHSEVVLQEAAAKSKIIALIEKEAIELNSPQLYKSVHKALTEIGWESFYLAKSKGHVIYLEGSTDLHMLLHFATLLKHPVESPLRFANVQYTANNVPLAALNNFSSLQTMFPALKGIAIFDNVVIQPNPKLSITCWEKREMENYFARPNVLVKWAKLQVYKHQQLNCNQLAKAMTDAIALFTPPAYLNDLNNAWWSTEKLSDNWLDKVFSEFYKSLNFPKGFFKRDYYHLISLLAPNEVDPEIITKLDLLNEVLQ